MALLSEYHKLSEGSENAQNMSVLKGLNLYNLNYHTGGQRVNPEGITEAHLSFTIVANWDEMAVKLKCRKNHWEYENKQYTIEKSIENANRNAKKNFKFFKICLFLGPFWKK